MKHPFGAHRLAILGLLLPLAVSLGIATSCATSTKSDSPEPGGGGGGGSSSGGGIIGGGSGGGGGNGGKGVVIGACSPACGTWSTQGGPNIVDPSAPSNAASLFSQPGTAGSGPCLREPTLGPGGTGSMFPRNWLRPRFEIANPTPGQVYEITLTSPNESGALNVYLGGVNADAGGTGVAQWTMPDAMWQALVADDPAMTITVTVSSVSASGGTPVIGSKGDIEIAPADANGAMIYWSTSGYDNSATSTELQGFQVGDDNTATVLTSSQVRQPVRAVPLSPMERPAISRSLRSFRCGASDATPRPLTD